MSVAGTGNRNRPRRSGGRADLCVGQSLIRSPGANAPHPQTGHGHRNRPAKLEQCEESPLQTVEINRPDDHEIICDTTQSCNCVRHGVRFLYRITLGLPDPHFYLPGAKTPSTLPQILNRDELVRLFTVTTNRKHRALLMTAYAAGLRASELGRLQLSDIDSERMCLRVDQGKGNKDRYVPLSPRLLDELREYWRRHHPQNWLFPSDLRSRPMMTRAGPAHIYKAAKDKAGIDKPGGIHTLRHCYATGLLEAGVELHVIQRRLGHSSIRSTMRYLHLAHDKTSSTPSPLDLLEFPQTGQS